MSIAVHLPALQVVLPLISAPLAVLLRNGSVAFVIVTAGAWAAFAIAIGLWLQVGQLDGHRKRLDATVVAFPHYDPTKARVRA